MSDKRTFKIEKAKSYWKKRTYKVVKTGKGFKILRPYIKEENKNGTND